MMRLPRLIRSLRLMVQLSVRADGRRSLGAVLTAVGGMVTQPLRTIGLKLLTDGIVGGSVSTIVAGVALIGGLQALSRCLFWASFNLRMRLRENTQVYLDSYMMELTAGIAGIEHHERPEYLDQLELIRAERWAIVNPFNPISWSLASAVQVASAFVLLVGVDARLAFLPLAGLPAVAATVHAQRVAARLRDEQAEVNRRMRHLQDLTTQPSTAKEVRIYELVSTLMRRRRNLFAGAERARIRQEVITTGLLIAAWLFFGACYVAALAATVGLASEQLVSPGSVVLVLSLGSLLIGQLSELAYNLAWLMRTERGVAKLVWLVEYAAAQHRTSQPVTPVAAPQRLRHGIQLHNVAFGYPGTDRPVISGVDLLLPAGRTIALVGINGAGKTTLGKLLCRFYEPTSGRITVDGIDLQRIPVDELATAIGRRIPGLREAGACRARVRGRRRPAADRQRRRGTPGAGSRGSQRRPTRAAGGPGDAARADLRWGCRPVVGAMAEACDWTRDDAPGAAGTGARRADREPGCADRACALRALRSGGAAVRP